MRRLAPVLLVLLLAGCGSSSKPAAKSAPSPSPTSIALSGDIELKGIDNFDTSDVTTMLCAGTGGYSDISAGASVTIEDASGKVVATTAVGEGKQVLSADQGAACRFTFSTVVPSADFYKVEVSHRGTVTFTRYQAQTGDVHLTIGS